MGIELIIMAALAIAQVAAAIYIVFLTFSEIVDWFSNRRSMSSVDRSRLGFTLQDMMNNGQYRTVQGVFNQAVGSVEDARTITSGDVDSTLAGYHQDQRLVVYP
ncbi:hypothetical protein Dvina_20500 [Dactylosporangium vinaceum]|uniref:Uncharacterized protein n=1 Tax=Dactylosporangium vinaceum TaxID=53362 RepID=A0ABV5MS77_9ACTN|nr:hypothetical protein [Dactylosporangium vinaceum]UAC00228.1 hypothetical protein Dvina_20500 [Dactylosporangium vinaceum]